MTARKTGNRGLKAGVVIQPGIITVTPAIHGAGIPA